MGIYILYIIFRLFILHYNKTVVVKGIDSAFFQCGTIFCQDLWQTKGSLLQWVMTEGNTL